MSERFSKLSTEQLVLLLQGEEKKNVNIELTSIGENCSTIEYKNTQSLLEFKASIAARSKGIPTMDY